MPPKRVTGAAKPDSGGGAAEVKLGPPPEDKRDQTNTKHFCNPYAILPYPETVKIPARITNTKYAAERFDHMIFTAADEEQVEEFGLSLVKEHLPEEYEVAKNTFNYIFYKFKKGVLVLFVKGILTVFLPFENVKFKNEYSQFFEKIPTKEGDSPKDEWVANDFIVQTRINPGETYEAELKDLLLEFQEVYKDRELTKVFFVNKRDYPILRSDGKEPYTTIFNGAALVSHAYPKYTPIVAYSRLSSSAHPLFPTPDDWRMVCGKAFPKPYGGRENLAKIGTLPIVYPWRDKIDKAIFRGKATGKGINGKRNKRIRASELSLDYPETIDAKISVDVPMIREKLVPIPDELIPFHGAMVPKFQSYIKATLKEGTYGEKFYTSWEEQSKCKFLLHIAGNAGAYRLGKELLSNCTTIRVKQNPGDRFIMWLDEFLSPGTHYIEADVEDVPGIVLDKRRYEEYGKIAADALKLAQTIITKEKILEYVFRQISSF